MPTGKYDRKPKDPKIELLKRAAVSDGCWNWTKKPNSAGYGTIMIEEAG